MLRLRSLGTVLFATLALFLNSGAGCSMLTGTEPQEEDEHVVAEVDSITVPAQSPSSDTLSVRLLGTVGPTGCYSFDRFDVERSADRLTVTPVVAQVTSDNISCTQAIVPLDETYKAAPPFEEGPLTIVVPQPDRPDVTTTVEVR